jgi:hypothetical protein
MHQLYQDAMAIMRTLGKPDLFITMTCNPNWSEILAELAPGQSQADRPDLISHVFKMKLEELKTDLYKTGIFGQVVGHIHVIEFQFRGLPHAHILIFLAPGSKFNTVEQYDRVVSAEIPDPELYPLAYATVTSMMMHGPCGAAHPNAPCMVDGRCTKNYPKSFQSTTTQAKDGYPVYRRWEDG